MDLDEIKAQLDRIFAARPGQANREQAAGLHEALIEFKVAIGQLREELTRSEGQLAAARREAEDYERRGRMATEIQDDETASLAAEFAARVRERIDLLERKVLVQRDELTIAEREYDITRQRFQSAKTGIPFTQGTLADSASSDGTADSSGMDGFLMDQRAREAAVEAQLAHLKKKLGERG